MSGDDPMTGAQRRNLIRSLKSATTRTPSKRI
ncbi:MAG: hypothetical protein WAM99_13830 [Xanthobacteraceae bacterium]